MNFKNEKRVGPPIRQPSYPPAFCFSAYPASTDAPPPAEAVAMKPASEKKQITRNRASYSCVICRKRKIKCDKVHPVCSNCAKTNDQCLYSINARQNSVAVNEPSPDDERHGTKRRKADTEAKESSSDHTSPVSSADGAPPESADTPAMSGSIESRLDRLTALVEALSKPNGVESTENANALIEPGIRRERRTGNRPSFTTNRSAREAVPKSTALRSPQVLDPAEESRFLNLSMDRLVSRSPVYDFDLPSGDLNDLADPLANLNLGYLSIQEGGRSRYIGSTYWAYISDELDQLNILLREQNRYISANGMGNQNCERATREHSPSSEESPESHEHNSFHKAGDNAFQQKTQLRDDCEACLHTSFDKSVLLNAADAHPSRFKRMDPDMLKGLPTEDQSHILFRCWLSGVHMHIPLIYPPVALQKYEQFWEWYRTRKTTNSPLPDPSIMALLYAIWYAGSVSISLRGFREWFKGTTRAAISAHFHDQITRCLTLTAFPRNGSIPALVAFLMLQTILAREEEPLTSSLFVGLALRVAQNMGLHRDPELFSFLRWEAESRRRIWWYIVSMDSAVAISSGLPPLINDDHYWDVKHISELKDLKLNTPEGREYAEALASGKRTADDPDEPLATYRPSMVAVQYVAAKGKYITADAFRRLLKIHLGTKSITRKDLEEIRKCLNEVRNRLNGIIRRIPTKGIPELGFVPDRDMKTGRSLVADFDSKLANPPSEEELAPFLGMTPKEGLNDHTVKYHWNTLVAFHKWTRIVLSLLIDKIFCVSYQPFLKNAKSKLWPLARQCALRHCHGFMRKFISLATDPAFQPFHWSWPGSHQPMHATMIMLIDLYERPTSTEAPKSRAFIDQIFSMSGPDGGIVSGEDGVTVQRPLREGGREAWDMLRRLREKAWQRAGLDPDVLWTEEDQIRAGVAQPLTEAERKAQSHREDAIHMPGPKNVGDSSRPSLPRRPTSVEAVLGFEPSAPTQEAESRGPQPAERHKLQNPVFREPTALASNTQTLPNILLSAPELFSDQILTSRPVGSGELPLFPHHPTVSNPVAPIPLTNPYFNPPTAASSNTQQSGDSGMGPTPSDNLILNIHNAPSPVIPSFKPSNDAPNGATGGGQDEHFDWDQWDAVFGQHVPLDVMMEDVVPWGDMDNEDSHNSMDESG